LPLIAQIDALNHAVQKLSPAAAKTSRSAAKPTAAPEAPSAKTAAKAAAAKKQCHPRPPHARPAGSLTSATVPAECASGPDEKALWRLFDCCIATPSGSRRAYAVVKSQAKPKIALAVAGGGPLGVSEVGAMCALGGPCRTGFNRLDHYVGVSAGGFIAAALANGISRALCASFMENSPAGPDINPPAWMRPALPGVPPAQRQAALAAARLSPSQLALGQKTALNALERCGGADADGFSNHYIDAHLSRLFASAGRARRFRQLGAQLTWPRRVRRPGWDHVRHVRPRCRPVRRAPSVPPVEINESCMWTAR